MLITCTIASIDGVANTLFCACNSSACSALANATRRPLKSSVDTRSNRLSHARVASNSDAVSARFPGHCAASKTPPHKLHPFRKATWPIEIPARFQELLNITQP